MSLHDVVHRLLAEVLNPFYLIKQCRRPQIRISVCKPELRQIFFQDSHETRRLAKNRRISLFCPHHFFAFEEQEECSTPPHFNVSNIKCNAVKRGGTMLFAFMSQEEIHLCFKQIRGEFHWKKDVLRSLQLHNYCL
ncbi:hypothetical protein CEXT_543641 [Caerostris extrusa]|uniref:Uncharacterized protein n=1 Tax=Caerostris extrusa TaxID=172846 RepID=A0AAV4R2Q8_CAEEX|nr:hypothetical protein CEXT_543641 [Caerostris extrusa]